MSKNQVKDKSYELALAVIELYKHLVTDQREYVISKQLLRSGTSVGANIRESEYAESKADFLHKLLIALKECNESEYWLDLLTDSELADSALIQPVRNLNKEVLKLLISITKSLKSK